MIDYTAILQRKLYSMFNDDSIRDRVCIELDRYGIESHEQETDRVKLAILKIADSDVKEIQAQVDSAKIDYRDILAYAEYPNQMKAGWNITDERLMEIDKQQYEAWLEK